MARVGSWGILVDAGAVAICASGEGVVPLRLPPLISICVRERVAHQSLQIGLDMASDER